ncbi:MAG: hypothetical protein Q8L08_00965 [Candidatus Nanopelagicaceae bacterium]|nr:hypothetical protein [Candidatus Nanopelagicaceae bacterium]
MNRSTITIALAALIGATIGFMVAPREGAPAIPICYSYHDNKSVETFEVPTGTTCPSGFTYGRGRIANTLELIPILELVAKNNFRNGTEYGKSLSKK